MGDSLKKQTKKDSDSESDSDKVDKVSDTYEKDNFDEASVSGSGQQNKLTYWPGKNNY
jgi:hypothetical protein